MKRSITIMMHTDGALETRQYRVPLWAVRVARGGAIVVGALVLLFFAFAGPITRNAARAALLERDVERLRTENARVQELAAALDRAEARYVRLRRMLGAGVVPERPRVSPGLPQAVSVGARLASLPPRYEIAASAPRHWPFDGTPYITRRQRGRSATGEAHPGIDLAAAVGTPVRASGGGSVADTGEDPEYGLYVLLAHPDGYQTLYGHAARILVAKGDTVPAGQVIALSGNSGRSTAPHLHFEIRRNGTSIDPLTLLKPQS